MAVDISAVRGNMADEVVSAVAHMHAIMDVRVDGVRSGFTIHIAKKMKYVLQD